MDRRTLLGVAIAALSASALPVEAGPVYPDTVEGQTARLEVLRRQIEEHFESVFDSNKRSERDVDVVGPTCRVVEQRVYVHKTYINGLPKPEGAECQRLTSPRAAVDEFERHFLPEAERHTGELLWRVKPQLRTLHDLREGETVYRVRHRCSFSDSPDSVVQGSFCVGAHNMEPTIERCTYCGKSAEEIEVHEEALSHV
jgi:hypothetical protein